MTSEDMLAVYMSRREMWMMKKLINQVADWMIEDRDYRNYLILDLCSKLNKRIDDALEGGV